MSLPRRVPLMVACQAPLPAQSSSLQLKWSVLPSLLAGTLVLTLAVPQPPSQPRTLSNASLHASLQQDATTTMTTSQHRDYVMQRTAQLNLTLQQRYQDRVASIRDSERRSIMVRVGLAERTD